MKDSYIVQGKKNEKEKNIVIYGFDYETTEKIIDSYTAGNTEFSSIYVNEGAHREDLLLCHLRIREGNYSPYIFKGTAEIIHAKNWTDAARYYEWIKEGGTVCISEPWDESGHNVRMKEFILRQEKAGLIKVVYL